MNPTTPILNCLLAATLAAQDDSARLQQTLREIRAIRAAESVVVARVVEVHPSPGFWCGYAVSEQKVTYRIDRVVDGKPHQGVVEVSHLLVAESPLVARHAPFLRPDLFYEGAQAVLCISGDEEGGHLRVLDETYGARLVSEPRQPDEARTAIVTAVLSLAELRPYWHLEVEGAVPRCVLNESVPLPFELGVGGKAVEFLPPELLAEERHVEITALEVDGGAATVTFRMRGEGVVGSASLARDAEGWRVVESEVAER